MIILNACSNVKISLDDDNMFHFFCTRPDPPVDFEMHLLDGVIVDNTTACFLREFPIEWLRSEDQLMAVRVDASDEICREFLKSSIIDAEVLLDDEEGAF